MIRLRAVLPAVFAWLLLTAGLARLVGTPVVWSALIALPMAAVLLLLLATPPGVEPTWAAPPEPPSAATHLDASTMAGRFEDSSTDQGRFRGRVQPRLAKLALGTLRGRAGLGDLADLSDPRAAAALGPRLHALLTDPTATLPEPRVLLEMLERLEEQ
jgi:hypothetical protein